MEPAEYVKRIVKPACKIIDGRTKEAVLREMLQGLATAGEIPEDKVDDLLSVIMKREELGSTGIGNGLAIPHSSIPVEVCPLKKQLIIFCVAPNGVDFKALDSEPVTTLVMILTSKAEETRLHLKALESTARLFRNMDFLSLMNSCKTLGDIMKVIDSITPPSED